MKNKIFKFLFLMILAMSIIGCGTARKSVEKDSVISGAMYGFTKTITSAQLDSVCAADTLPRDLSKWNASAFTDFETRARITKMVYIKSDEMMYILIPRDTLFKLTKMEVR